MQDSISSKITLTQGRLITYLDMINLFLIMDELIKNVDTDINNKMDEII